MFITNDANKHPLSRMYGKGNHLWTGIDIQIRRAWFILDYKLVPKNVGDDELEFTNTVVLANPDDVLDLALQDINLLSVSLIAPLLDPKKGGWSIDRLTGIWECTDPGDPHMKAKIFTKEDDSYHVHSLLGSTVKKTDDWTLLLALPT